MKKSSQAKIETDYGQSCETTQRSPLSTKVLALTFIIILPALIGFGWYAWCSYARFKTAANNHHRITHLNSTIIHLDEVLTMSAKMAAATDDQHWEQRYRKYEPVLDTAIKEAIALAPKAFMGKSIAQTDTANIKLVEMENRAFDLVRQANHEAAHALLHSQEYEKQKHIYSEGLQQYISALEKHTQTQTDESRNIVLWVSILIVFLVLLAVFSGTAGLQLRRHLTIRKQVEQEREKVIHDMGERIKELRCMYSVATSIRTRRRLKEVFQDVVEVIPPGWHYPEITRARIRFDEAEYVSGPFEETPWKMRSGIIVDGAECGSVEVCYLQERPALDEGPFLKEERSLIDGIAHALSEAAEHVRAEKALYRAKRAAEDTNIQLEESVERANMLAQEATATSEQLREMQSQIVQSEKLASIGQLAAGVAHEMNTPVGFVASNFETLESYMGKITKLLGQYGELGDNIATSGNTELVNKAAVIADSRRDMKIDFVLDDIGDLFDDSKEGLERVTDIIQNLRDFSRIDQPGSLDKYNINDGIKATLVVVQNEIKYNSDVKTEFSELPEVLCHSGQINQVLLNILLNAAQAITSQEREDRGTITIRTYATETDAVCEISDDGPGIPPDELTRVFDPFFTTKPAGKGTGLGLSVSYDIIVHKHDGELLVESTVGEGTKFTLKLPLGRSDPDYVEEIEDNCIHNKACD